MNHISTGRLAIALGLCAMALGTVSCEDEPDKYKGAEGTPTIQFIRSTDL